MKKQITLLVVGFGDRAHCYLRYAERFPEQAKLVAVVDPDPKKILLAQKEFGVKPEYCFADVNEAVKLGKIADCAINTTMDNLHISTTVPLLKAGYDVLLEKPICNNQKELLYLEKTADKYKRKLMICHVLRYTPYYRKIKDVVMSGEIGKIVQMETNEHVCLNHASHSYIRGKWQNEQECGSTLLLAKCCHDLDLLCWFNSGTEPKYVSSFGGRTAWVVDNAPQGAGNRCLVDCPHKDTCQFSVQSMYVDNNEYENYAYDCINKNLEDITLEEKVESLKTNNPHGICAYKTDFNLVDHQSVIIEFENGVVAEHTLFLGTPRPGRHFHLCGTLGEIEGDIETGRFVVRKYDKVTAKYTEKKYDVRKITEKQDRHAGGDMGIMKDFISIMKGNTPSVSYTNIKDSINGHLCVYAADKARVTRSVIQLK